MGERGSRAFRTLGFRIYADRRGAHALPWHADWTSGWSSPGAVCCTPRHWLVKQQLAAPLVPPNAGSGKCAYASAAAEPGRGSLSASPDFANGLCHCHHSGRTLQLSRLSFQQLKIV